MSLVNTEPGERVIYADYGVPLAELLFEEGEEFVIQDLRLDLSKALDKWEPGIVMNSLVPVPTPGGSEEDGLVTVGVAFARRDTPTASNIPSANSNYATISAGGTVRQVIRG